ncbi:MAG TPA: hypothetical protein DEH25_04540 [Chloroflexi bacterium]|nr:hypothetical protein [Chloroflexota bacterium]HBY08264.1 hypothetical protein [Chloroflexota bacterium]
MYSTCNRIPSPVKPNNPAQQRGFVFKDKLIVDNIEYTCYIYIMQDKEAQDDKSHRFVAFLGGSVFAPEILLRKNLGVFVKEEIMFETIIDWVADHFGEPSRHVSIEIYTGDDFSYSDVDRAEISSYDAMACNFCQGYTSEDNIPSGKQVI